MDKAVVFKLFTIYIIFIAIIPNSSIFVESHGVGDENVRHSQAVTFISNEITKAVGFPKQNLIQNLKELFKNENEDMYLNIQQLIRKYGYSAERHVVKTQDGYILTMYRIPGNSSTVFLMHGLCSSADDMVTPGPKSSIAYLLANQGYDVWLGNARGNKHCRKHEAISPKVPEFWNYSFDEIGRYDLPAMIDYVLNLTGRTQLKYVGHSQGTTSFFVMCSERPEYNEKISLMVALSPIAWMSHLKSPLIRLMSSLNPFLINTLELLGVYEFAPHNAIFKGVVNSFCGDEELAVKYCANFVFYLCGYDKKQLNVSNLPVFFAHLPGGSSTKQLLHYGQEIVSGKFQKFDYGQKKNKEVYGTKMPPEYPVGKITAPVALFYCEEDWLANVTDVEILKSELHNVVEYYKVPFESFNHLDFIWALDVKTLIVDKMLQLFERY